MEKVRFVQLDSLDTTRRVTVAWRFTDDTCTEIEYAMSICNPLDHKQFNRALGRMKALRKLNGSRKVYTANSDVALSGHDAYRLLLNDIMTRFQTKRRSSVAYDLHWMARDRFAALGSWHHA